MDMGGNGGQVNHRVGGGRSDTGVSVRGGSAVSRWVDPACPLTATYLVLDIELGPCLDQQVHAAVLATGCGKHERRVAILHHEWTWGATGVGSITGGEEGGVARGVECEGWERSESVGGSCERTSVQQGKSGDLGGRRTSPAEPRSSVVHWRRQP